MNSTANDLFNLLVGRDYTVKTLSNQGKPVVNPSEAEMFSFDFETSNSNYGTVVILLDDESNFEVYYGDNIGKNMEGNDKDVWYDFLNQLKRFATRNLLNFNLKNLNKLKYSMQGMAAINEGLFEGWNGTKHTSYNNKPGTTRLKIVHSKAIEEGEQRWRAIDKLYVENADGERFKLPFTSLVAGRAMARHVAEGGTPYDVFGQHIIDIVREANVLAKFTQATRTITEEDGEQFDVVEAGRERYKTLRHRLKSLAGKRGYHAYKESWNPATIEEGIADTNDLHRIFTRETIDPRIEEALPYLTHTTKETESKESTMKEFDKFANWADSITEGTWAIPDDETKIKQLKNILAEPLPVGVDAMNATNVLYDIIGDDGLFDSLAELADEDPEADARPIIEHWIEMYTNSYPGLEDLADRILSGNDELEFEEAQDFDARGMNKYGLSAVKGPDGFYALVDGKVVAGPFASLEELKAYQEEELNKDVNEQLDIDTGKEQRKQERDSMLEMNAYRRLAGLQEKVYENFDAFTKSESQQVEEGFHDTPLLDKEDFLEKSKALYDMMMNPEFQDEETLQLIQDRINRLNDEARKMGIIETTEQERANSLKQDILGELDASDLGKEGVDWFAPADTEPYDPERDDPRDDPNYGFDRKPTKPQAPVAPGMKKTQEANAGKFGQQDDEIADPKQIIPGGAQDDGKIADEKDIEEPKLDERSLTKGEEKKREKYVKGMKKSKADFKKRYGDRGEEVMYATATKMAKEGEGETTGGSNMFGKGIYESLTELENDLDVALGNGITATSQLDNPENPVDMIEPDEIDTTDVPVGIPTDMDIEIVEPASEERNIGDQIADKGAELSAQINSAIADIKRLAGMGN